MTPSIGEYIFYAENTQDGHNKFWAIQRSKMGTYIVSWGKIGAKGQMQEIDASEAETRRAEKLRKGYIPIFAKLAELNGTTFYEEPVKKTKEKKLDFDFMEELKRLG